MNLRQNNTKRTIHAPAKLNLSLAVLGRRDDGYHELSTLMAPIGIYDSLSFESLTGGDRVSGPGPIEFSLCDRGATELVPRDHTNLVVRAIDLLRRRSGIELGARVRLIKRIPSEAGLGGGSSDAAAALKLANHVWGIHWPKVRLAALAAELGSDVPFFIERGAALCRGRGNHVTRIGAIKPLDIVVVKPSAGLATAAVFAALAAQPVSADSDDQLSPAEDALVQSLRRGMLPTLQDWMGNGLQRAAISIAPWLTRLENAFQRLDFAAHQLSGSGSAYFGICRSAQHARRLAATLAAQALGQIYVTRTCN